MSEPNGAVKDPETSDVPSEPRPGSWWKYLIWPGLSGGIADSIVGGVGLGLVTMIVGMMAYPRWMTDPDYGPGPLLGLLGGILGVLLAFPLGVARGLRSAGALLGLRVRYWPTVSGAYIGVLLVPLLGPVACWLTARQWGALQWFVAVPLLSPLLSLVGGLVGYQLSQPKRPDDARGDS